MKYTTIVIDTKNVVYDLGKSEFPDRKSLIVNALTCTLDDKEKLIERYSALLKLKGKSK